MDAREALERRIDEAEVALYDKLQHGKQTVKLQAPYL